MIGKRIEKRRKNQKITMQELGEKVGITKSTIHKYETGMISRIDTAMVKQISDVLCINPSILTGWVDVNLEISKRKSDLLSQTFNLCGLLTEEGLEELIEEIKKEHLQ